MSPQDRPGKERTARLFAGEQALKHIRILESADGKGIWLPDLVANALHMGAGDRIRLLRSGTRVLLPVAHAAGVRNLALEAFFDPKLVEEANDCRHVPEVRGPSYLAQPEMRVLIQAALDLGWTLMGYGADMRLAPDGWDPMGEAFTDWREEQQARNPLDGAR